MKKPVFGVFDQVRLKPVCSAVCHEIANIETRDTILSRQGTTKVLIRLRRLFCTFVGRNGISRFSHVEAQA